MSLEFFFAWQRDRLGQIVWALVIAEMSEEFRATHPIEAKTVRLVKYVIQATTKFCREICVFRVIVRRFHVERMLKKDLVHGFLVVCKEIVR